MPFFLDTYGTYTYQPSKRYKQPILHWYARDTDAPFTLCGKGGYRGLTWYAVYSLDKKFKRFLRTYHPDRVTCPRCKKLRLAQRAAAE